MISMTERIQIIRSGTHAVIDLDAYARNLATLRSLAPAGTALMPVIKADGYGHGAAMCGHAAVAAGAEMLGVARITEALYLRQQGIATPILVLGPPAEEAIDEALANDITLAIGTERSLLAVESAAQRRAVPATIHLKIDTGMRRYGFLPDEAPQVAERVASNRALRLEGIFTHFTSADDADDSVTPRQIALFEGVTSEIDRRGIDVRYRHMANSAGILRGHFGSSNMVRSGIATYGLSPSPEVPVDERFEPILSLHSVVARRLRVQPGDGVSYNRTFQATVLTEAADIPIGYADGLPRNVSNVGWFIVHGERCPILGRVCMDQAIIQVPEQVREGDAVLILGSGDQGEMTFNDAGRLAGTNNYEVATRLMARVPRVYVRDGEPVAWEQLLSGERGNAESIRTPTA
jgi:alanine racemase